MLCTNHHAGIDPKQCKTMTTAHRIPHSKCQCSSALQRDHTCGILESDVLCAHILHVTRICGLRVTWITILKPNTMLRKERAARSTNQCPRAAAVQIFTASICTGRRREQEPERHVPATSSQYGAIQAFKSTTGSSASAIWTRSAGDLGESAICDVGQEPSSYCMYSASPKARIGSLPQRRDPVCCRIFWECMCSSIQVEITQVIMYYVQPEANMVF